MSTELEIRERQKNHLQVLLELKRKNRDIHIEGLESALKTAVIPMNQEDIAWVEKIIGVNALD